MINRLLSVGISSEQDVVIVRQRAREISAQLGFGAQDQVRIATATSEIARNALACSSGGRADFLLEEADSRLSLSITVKTTVRDGVQSRPGSMLAADLETAITSASRLMDGCRVESDQGRSTSIILKKNLPMGTSISRRQLESFVDKLARIPEANTWAETQLQNTELLETLAELRMRQDELLSLTRELEDTNRGVVVLSAEIESKAERLREADESKTRFLSNTSHELRTPLSSIRALAQLLLDRIDGELTPEQEKQVNFIARSASELSELVNDLLDLAKIESGKIEVSCSEVNVGDLFRGLRGAMSPLLGDLAVELIFEAPPAALTLYTDEVKLAQILRNFVSNALKFTEHGSVRVFAEQLSDEQHRICVRDSGIGIAPNQLQYVFEEFSQIPNALQSRSKGTGLGLPLCRTLATLLGGSVHLESALGEGSTFSVILPTSYCPPPTSPSDADA